jgi:hypothetical protein
MVDRCSSSPRNELNSLGSMETINSRDLCLVRYFQRRHLELRYGEYEVQVVRAQTLVMLSCRNERLLAT